MTAALSTSLAASMRQHSPAVVGLGAIEAALLITRHALVVLAAAALMAGTIVGFVHARTVGLFNFKLLYSATLADQVLVVEIAATVIGVLAAWVMWRADRTSRVPG